MIMRKMIIALCLLILISTQITGCTKAISNSNKSENKATKISIKKSKSGVREIAYQSLDEDDKKSVINRSTAPVQEGKSSAYHRIASHEGVINIRNTDTYIVTFNTNNASLGDITIYVDKNSYKVLGYELRD